MEIYRIDGGGRTDNHERLMETFINIVKKIPLKSNFWSNIIEIIDRKGLLIIVINDINEVDIYLYYTSFYFEWLLQGENQIQIICNDEIIMKGGF